MRRKKEKNILEELSDLLDDIDRITYWHRSKIIINGAFIVVIIAPLLDLLLTENQAFTVLSTEFYSLLLMVLLLSWLNRWRDEEGNWSFHGVIDRLKKYLNLFFLAKSEVLREKDFGERLYNISYYMFYAGVIVSGFGKASLCIRKYFSIESPVQERFEIFSNYAIAASGLATLLFIYIFYKYPEFIKIDFLYRKKEQKLTDWKKFSTAGIFVLDAKNQNHIDSLISANVDIEILKSFLNSIKDWSPGRNHDEFMYQYKLANYLRKKMPEQKISKECPIGTKDDINRGRADFVIDDTILIEMKKNINSSGVQRAVGQIDQYLSLWNKKGLVILLLCDISYTYALESFSEYIAKQNKSKRPVICIVVSDRK